MSEIRKTINDSNDKIVNKVKNLLALSRNSNQDEENQSTLGEEHVH